MKSPDPAPTKTDRAGRPTMKDVAAKAGVGLSTVSRVVAGKGGVSPQKVRAVERAIRELDFSRNDFAHTLRTGTAGTIGMLVTNISDPFFSAVIDAVEERARERDQLVLISSSSDDAQEGIRVIRRLTQRRLDGLIIVAPEGADLAFLNREKEAGTPIVFVDQPPSGIVSDLVCTDNEGGMRDAVLHLTGAGHRRIACIAHIGGRYTSERRQEGYLQGLAAAGLAPDPSLIAEVRPDVEACVEVLGEMLAAADPPTALVTTNGRTTVAVLEAVRRLRAALAIVSFDDFELAPLMDPPTTAIAQDPVTIGHAAADLLFERSRNLGGAPRRVVVGAQLIVRGSGESAPAAVG